ncbi:MAG: pyruvate, phosphate dikinase [Alphaproteobacteria bacterium]|nr:pyruvate, phosphate dikinase [Alphaproteobacteria bacterium]
MAREGLTKVKNHQQVKFLFGFGDGQAEGRADLRNLLGGKGANLAEMSLLGLPVPPGFTLSTELCRWYYDHDHGFPDSLAAEVAQGLQAVEASTGMRFSDPTRPLLVSVRSGARASMPGMMDTVLNLGLNDATVAGLAELSGDPRFAFDSYRRFIQMYSNVVLGIPSHYFEEILGRHKDALDLVQDTELTADHWRAVIIDYKQEVMQRQNGTPFPESPQEQLWQAIGAVFKSWMNPRAMTYRRLNDIPTEWGTAVTVQAMVFGNMGNDCATGVAFTRNPSTGENAFYGEYLVNAQGEDVVAGIRTPQSLTIAGRISNHSILPSMEEAMPAVYAELLALRSVLEKHFRDVQDIEFTVQQGKLYLLQTRNGKRTAQAALRIAVEFVAEGVITREEALRRIDPRSLEQSLHPRLDPKAARVLLGSGLPASPGAASGRVVFTADEAESFAARGEETILVRIETSPEDIHGMHAARGILTTRGGMTSHAAVVARGMGRPCVAGAGSLRVDYVAGFLTAVSPETGAVLRVEAGEIITIDGMSGQVFMGTVPTLQPELSSDFATLMGWADGVRKLRVRANAETELDATTARRFGAEGIGLCRTEHMFFDDDRIVVMREMILAETPAGRKSALAKLLPMQRDDFVALFEVMAGLPVTIRLLDPPLHEFLPHSAAEIAEVAVASGISEADLRARSNALSESNPMLGHRGCRLGISYPEIYEMQVRAIFEAVIALTQSHPNSDLVIPEIMIPLVGSKREFEIMRELVDKVAAEITATTGIELPYLVGTMIELPRACLEAEKIAETAEFFSFGTNDLTQTCYGLSRDDAGSFLGTYVAQGILAHDPFVSIDQDGVGALMRLAVKGGRATRPALKMGICGEHGGDPDSIAFCANLGLDYVSCSPYRVPIARLAAAQAALAVEYDQRDR